MEVFPVNHSSVVVNWATFLAAMSPLSCNYPSSIHFTQSVGDVTTQIVMQLLYLLYILEYINYFLKGKNQPAGSAHYFISLWHLSSSAFQSNHANRQRVADVRLQQNSWIIPKSSGFSVQNSLRFNNFGEKYENDKDQWSKLYFCLNEQPEIQIFVFKAWKFFLLFLLRK